MGDDFLPPDPGAWEAETPVTPPDFEAWESEWDTSADTAEDTADTAEDTPAEPALTAAEQAAQAKRLESWVSEYLDLLPRIEVAKPLPAQSGSAGELKGAERVAESVRQFLAARKQRLVFTVEVREDAVVADVDVPAEPRKQAYGDWLAEGLRERGHCGEFEAHVRGDGHILLVRRGVTGPGGAWRAAGAKAAQFFADPAARNALFELCKLHQTRKSDGRKRYPSVHSFGEDDRGGTCELRLQPGQVLAKAQAAEGALRQALNAPDLVVDYVGVHPLIRLNTRAITREFPRENPLSASMFVRPRTQAERHVAAKDFVLPLGAKADGSPLLIPQDRVPHLGVFGGTGAGKTVLLASIVQAAVLQGGEVILADAKNGKDLRGLALAHLPGVVSYNAGGDAALHRAVLYAREELARRQQLAAALQAKGIEYCPPPLLLVFDEAPAWINDRARASNPKPVRDAAAAVVGHLSYIASQAREHRIFLLTAGQFAYVSAFAGEWKTNTSTLVILGPPSEINRQALFEGEKRGQVSELGATITKEMKGRGLVADQESGRVELFQGFFNAPGPAAEAFTQAVMRAPKLRRFAWQFPLPGEAGGDGSWQEWTPATDPSSDDLPTVYLDGPDGNPLPDRAIFDPTSPQYSPGQRRIRLEHEHRNSYDN